MDENGLKSVLVAHPNKQHSFRTATALERSGRLMNYSTTVYDKEGNLTAFLKKIVPNQYLRAINGKKCADFDQSKVVQHCELSGIAFLVLARMQLLGACYRYFGAFMNWRFGRKVAKYAIKHQADAVVMFDTTACSCFQYLKRQGSHIKCILDMSSNASAERLKLYNRIIQENPDSELKKEFGFLWNEGFQKRNLLEIQNSDFFLTASNFSKESLIAQGADPNQIYVVPYGVDRAVFDPTNRKPSADKCIFVYTGNVTCQKGVDMLLDAFRELPVERCSLYLMGAYDSKSELYQKNKDLDNVFFMGFVSHEQLAAVYMQAHAFVFPSLGDGFSLSALEAMSSGLPAFCSENAGIVDIITDHVNGGVFPVGDKEKLKEMLWWIIEHPDDLLKMSQNAVKTAAGYTWETYYRNMNLAFDQILNDKLSN